MRVTSRMSKTLFRGKILLLVFALDSHAAEPTLHSSRFFGGAGDQRGTGVAIQGGNVYLSGVEGQGSETEALALSYANPPGPSPLWSTRWPNPSGTPAPLDDKFQAVAATTEGLYFPGASNSQTTDGVGGKEGKGILAKFPLTGATTPTWVAKPNFFAYTGVETLAGAVATTESGTPYIYVSGGGQPCSYFAYVVAKYDTAGNLIAQATDSSAGIDFNCSVPRTGFSDAPAVTTLNGKVYAAGYSAWQHEGDSPSTTASLWKYDDSLNLIWRRKNTTLAAAAQYLGVTAVGDGIYAVGHTSGSAGSEQYLVDNYDEAGNLTWTKTFGGADTDVLTGAIAVGNRVFVVGYTRSQGAGAADAVILEIDPATGNTLSTTLFGGSRDDIANAVATDAANLYIVGESRSFASAEGNAVGQNDVLLLRYAVGENPPPPPPPPSGADLALSLTGTPAVLTVNGQLTYAIDLRNNGPLAATGVRVTDTLPDTMPLATVSSTQGACGGTRTVSCELGTLAAGAQATVTIDVTATQSGSFSNTASVLRNEPDPVTENDIDTETTTVQPLSSGQADLAIAATATPDPGAAGQALSYVLTARNIGPATATGVVVTDNLPPGVGLGQISPSQGSCAGTRTVSCDLGPLVVGAEATVTIGVIPTVAGPLTNPSTVNGLTVNGDQVDPDRANNVASVTTTIQLPLALPTPQTASNCDSVRCRLRLACNLSESLQASCGNRVTLFAKTRAPRLSEERAARGPRLIRFAAGVGNVPSGQTGTVRLNLTPKGKELARRLVVQGKKTLRSEMRISNVAGGIDIIPLTVRLK